MSELPEKWREHFPANPQEAEGWESIIEMWPLSMKALVVGHTRIEGAWCAYAKDVAGFSHKLEAQDVLDFGDKLPESIARAFFPQFEGVPYAY